MTYVEDLQSRWGIRSKQLQDHRLHRFHRLLRLLWFMENHRLHRLHRLFSVLCVKTTGFGGGFVSFLAAASCSLSGRVFLAYTACRLPITVQYPSSVPSFRTETYPHFSSRWGIILRFLRSVSQSASSCSYLSEAPCRIASSVTASGRPSVSSTSANSASSGARLVLTISQNVGVLGGGALISKAEISSRIR